MSVAENVKRDAAEDISRRQFVTYLVSAGISLESANRFYVDKKNRFYVDEKLSVNQEVEDDISAIAPNLIEHASKLKSLVEMRLSLHAEKTILITYDGSIFDQLLVYFLKTTQTKLNYLVLCCTRPCMNSELIASVNRFAQSNNFQVLNIKDDCHVNFRTMKIEKHKCSGIQEFIKQCMPRDNGVQIHASISNEESLLQIRQWVFWYRTFTDPLLVGSGGEVLWPTIIGDHSWTNHLIFHNFMAYEILLCFLFFCRQEAKEWQVPLCYLPCYYEIEKMRLRTLIAHSQDDIIKEMRELEYNT